jgi:alkanesulfonate monooxygenase/4-(gamma-L-glutamylamino)butanoyl-[BtrI acyl-carrier protein] monooxygenase
MSERYHYTGALIHYNHLTLSPWIIATTVIEHTSSHVPLIALQPATMPPFTVAKIVQSIGIMYGRKVALNVVAGASKNEVGQIDDIVDHDQRYERMREYIEVIRMLSVADGPVTYHGNFYNLRSLDMKPALPAGLVPSIFVAGSSTAGAQVALNVADVAVTHPQPVGLFNQQIVSPLTRGNVNIGIRVGIVARSEASQAWEEARARFPLTRIGNVRTIQQRSSDSQWIKDLAQLALKGEIYDNVFWMGAYHSGKANCPYLVGAYDQIAQYIAQYIKLGVREILVDGPFGEDEFIHTDEVFQRVVYDMKN